MIVRQLIPTRLVDASERAQVEIVEPVPLSRFPAFHTIWRFLRWGVVALWFRRRGAAGRAEIARQLRVLFEELGGLWIKIGQLISLRNDVFSVELCTELAKLQDRAEGFRFELARAIVEQELGGPIAEFFEEFEGAPFAAASIGQTHMARLRLERTWVAVKVQRPQMLESMQNELSLVARLFRLFEWLRIQPHMRWTELAWELRHVLEEEIDYRFEASNMRRMKKTLKRHKIYVPKVYARYSSRRVLTTEFVTGALMADYITLRQTDPTRLAAWLTENNIKPRLLARRLCFSLMRQVIEDNLYHGDLHPGNIILLRDSRISLIDFGTVGFLEREYLAKFQLFVRALATRDYAKAADLAFLLSATLPITDLESAKQKMIQALRAWAARTYISELPYHQKSVDSAWNDIGRIMFTYKCTADWAYLRIRRAFSTLDASIMHLYPEANYTALTQQYFRRAERRGLRRFAGRAAIRRALTSLAHVVVDLPEKASELAFFNVTFARREAKVFQGATTKFAELFVVLFARLGLLSAVVGVLIGLLLLDRHQPLIVRPVMKGIVFKAVHALPALPSDTWTILLVVDAYLCWTFTRLRRRFERPDVRFESPSPRG
jgi:ubiquinone biosynthesis protein